LQVKRIKTLWVHINCFQALDTLIGAFSGALSNVIIKRIFWFIVARLADTKTEVILKCTHLAWLAERPSEASEATLLLGCAILTISSEFFSSSKECFIHLTARTTSTSVELDCSVPPETLLIDTSCVKVMKEMGDKSTT